MNKRTLDGLIRAVNRIATADDEWEGYAFHRPLRVWTGRANPRRTLFVTKFDSWLAADHGLADVVSKSAAVWSRWGLIQPPHASAIARQLGGREQGLFFVGDLDPGDLLIYLMLRVHLQPHGVAVHYLGIGDAWLERATREAGRRGNLSLDQITIPMGSFETACLRKLLRLDLDWATVIGPRSLDILASGQKIELEAMATYYTDQD